VYKLKVESNFSSAHNLRGYKGKCEELHGHNFVVEAVFEGETLGSDGMLVDFKILKQYLKNALDTLDHKYLNEISFFAERASSSECIAMFIFNTIKLAIKEKNIFLKTVKVWESEKACAAYRE